MTSGTKTVFSFIDLFGVQTRICPGNLAFLHATDQAAFNLATILPTGIVVTFPDIRTFAGNLYWPEYMAIVSFNSFEPFYNHWWQIHIALASLFLPNDSSSSPEINNHVELHGTTSGGTDSAVLDFFGPGQSTAGSVWQDASGNMNIASQVANSSININAFGTGMVAINSPIKNPNIPTSAPSSGAHFVCIDDAGDMYRSDTACK